MSPSTYILPFNKISMYDLDIVGGKNASLGEMITQLHSSGVSVPPGFATTADGYREFLKHNKLNSFIDDTLDTLNIQDLNALQKTGALLRERIREGSFPVQFEEAIRTHWQELQKQSQEPITVAVRSSATAEDLPEASFAGQQETFLNVEGVEAVLWSVKEVFASLFNDRAIAYRVHQNFPHTAIAISAGIQRMVRADKGASGVVFTLDTESGFEDVILITASYGLGELVVQGAVNPDEFYTYKPNIRQGKEAIIRKRLGTKKQRMIYSDSQQKGEWVKTEDVEESQQRIYCINDADILYLSQQALAIEEHYGCPMDIEWAKDGIDGKIYILQARPETVNSQQDKQVLTRFQLKEKSSVIVKGRSIGQGIGQGCARIIASAQEMHLVQPGDVLVTDMTDPDWEPVMKKAAAIVTNRGGRTCHAAIIARELGIPAVVGTSNGSSLIEDGQKITVSCSQGDTGYIYEGLLEYEKLEINIDKLPRLPFKIMMNVANPHKAFSFHKLPNEGVGLARLEFIISQMIRIHPKALLQLDSLESALRSSIEARIAAYDYDPIKYYVHRLSEGIASIAAAFSPKPVIVRLSDFKSNEYASLIGGQLFEPREENPMLGFRGAGRYISPDFQECFKLECLAVKRVREEMGFSNVQVMVPFVRTLKEAEQVIELLEEQGLKRGENGLKIMMMCEVPSNAILADHFLQYFDGFSIGSNDLTQLTLGLDRDSDLVAEQFDERDPAIKVLLHHAIDICKKRDKYVGICGQGPSDHADFAQWLMDEGIDSVSLNPDSVLETWLYLAKQTRAIAL